ncbi:class I SAM-dependent methyltransferase [Candidatus Daviesbacteria bacterium]|nr:class I SAM-dependent methyltransferase [Candidatus Daviesbacteria bacterium]
MKNSLDIWHTEKYYTKAGEASLDDNHPGMKALLLSSKDANTILDLGCGEGTRLNLLKGSGKRLVGIDISDKAIEMARLKYKGIEFVQGDLENLPFDEDEFDLVYSAFVLEHLVDPMKVLNQALKVLKKGGKIVLLAPNYGAPNRCSPPFKGSRLIKIFIGLIDDIKSIFFKSQKLCWNKVEPISTKEQYDIDWDTTIEPYIRSLVDYLSVKNVRMIIANSCWGEELPNAKYFQRIFRFLGDGNIYPFVFWGPHLVFVGEKI